MLFVLYMYLLRCCLRLGVSDKIIVPSLRPIATSVKVVLKFRPHELTWKMFFFRKVWKCFLQTSYSQDLTKNITLFGLFPCSRLSKRSWRTRMVATKTGLMASQPPPVRTATAEDTGRVAVWINYLQYWSEMIFSTLMVTNWNLSWIINNAKYRVSHLV